MKYIDTDNAMFFDVDDTLVMWHASERYKNKITIKDPYSGEYETLFINDSHVKLLIRSKLRGRTIIVWSHGGGKWAETVVKALELEESVDYVMTKVEDYVDDLDLKDWCVKNIYLNKGYGR